MQKLRGKRFVLSTTPTVNNDVTMMTSSSTTPSPSNDVIAATAAGQLHQSRDYKTPPILVDDEEIFIDGLLRVTEFPRICHRWNSNEEIASYLFFAQFNPHWITKDVKIRPPNASMILYNKKDCKDYKQDGYLYKKRKDGKLPREDHMRLKVKGVELIYANYVHSSLVPTFHRRSYWLLWNPDIVLVHYLNTPANELEQDEKILSSLRQYGSGMNAREILEQLEPMLIKQPITDDESTVDLIMEEEDVVPETHDINNIGKHQQQQLNWLNSLIELSRKPKPSLVVINCGGGINDIAQATTISQPDTVEVAVETTLSGNLGSSGDASFDDSLENPTVNGTGSAVPRDRLTSDGAGDLQQNDVNIVVPANQPVLSSTAYCRRNSLGTSIAPASVNSRQSIRRQPSAFSEGNTDYVNPAYQAYNNHRPNADAAYFTYMDCSCFNNPTSTTADPLLGSGKILNDAAASADSSDPTTRKDKTTMVYNAGETAEPMNPIAACCCTSAEMFGDPRGNLLQFYYTYRNQPPLLANSDNLSAADDFNLLSPLNDLTDNVEDVDINKLELSREEINEILKSSDNYLMSQPSNSNNELIINNIDNNNFNPHNIFMMNHHHPNNQSANLSNLVVNNDWSNQILLSNQSAAAANDDVINGVQSNSAAVQSSQGIDSNRVASQVIDSGAANLHNTLLEESPVINDYSPNWSYCEGGEKILLTGSNLHNPQVNYKCKFGEKFVQAYFVQVGVLKCYCPPQEAGVVNLSILYDNAKCGKSVESMPVRFQYRNHDIVGTFPRLGANESENNNNRSQSGSLGQQNRINVRFWLYANDSQFINGLLEHVYAMQQFLASCQQQSSSSNNESSSDKPDFVNIMDPNANFSGENNEAATICTFEKRFLQIFENLSNFDWPESETAGRFIKEKLPNHFGLTLLHFCAALGYVNLIDHLFKWKQEKSHDLLNSELDPNSIDDYGRTPFVWACLRNRVNVAKFLIRQCSDPLFTMDRTNKELPLVSAYRRGYLWLIKEVTEQFVLQSNGDPYGKDFDTALWVLTGGHVERSQLYLTTGIGGGGTSIIPQQRQMNVLPANHPFRCNQNGNSGKLLNNDSSTVFCVHNNTKNTQKLDSNVKNSVVNSSQNYANFHLPVKRLSMPPDNRKGLKTRVVENGGGNEEEGTSRDFEPISCGGVTTPVCKLAKKDTDPNQESVEAVEKWLKQPIDVEVPFETAANDMVWEDCTNICDTATSKNNNKKIIHGNTNRSSLATAMDDQPCQKVPLSGDHQRDDDDEEEEEDTVDESEMVTFARDIIHALPERIKSSATNRCSCKLSGSRENFDHSESMRFDDDYDSDVEEAELRHLRSQSESKQTVQTERNDDDDDSDQSNSLKNFPAASFRSPLDVRLSPAPSNSNSSSVFLRPVPAATNHIRQSSSTTTPLSQSPPAVECFNLKFTDGHAQANYKNPCNFSSVSPTAVTIPALISNQFGFGYNGKTGRFSLSPTSFSGTKPHHNRHQHHHYRRALSDLDAFFNGSGSHHVTKSRNPLEYQFQRLTLSDREQRELYEAAKVIQNAYRLYKQRVQNRRQLELERHAATVIQSYYRRYKQFCYFKKIHRAAALIQKNFRTYKANKRKTLINGNSSVIVDSEAVSSILSISSKNDHTYDTTCASAVAIADRIQVTADELRLWKQQLAAIKIQHAFRGHIKRQAAARTIQRFMRQSRQKLQETRTSANTAVQIERTISQPGCQNTH